MKAFKFRLETLLEMRERDEEKVKLKLAAKNSEIGAVRKSVASIHQSLKELQQSEKQQRVESLSIMGMRHSVAFRYKLKSDLLNEARKLDALSAEADTIRQELVEATRRRRAVEIIKDKRFTQWKKEYLKKEQGFIDDISQQGFIRNKEVRLVSNQDISERG